MTNTGQGSLPGKTESIVLMELQTQRMHQKQVFEYQTNTGAVIPAPVKIIIQKNCKNRRL